MARWRDDIPWPAYNPLSQSDNDAPREQTMPHSLRTSGLLAALAVALVAAEHDTKNGEIVATPADFKWQEGPPSLPKGAKVALLEGNLSKAGAFVLRVKMPDGYRIP